MITKRNIIIVAVVLSITGCLYAQNTKQQKASNRPINMNTTNICELPEDINILNQYIKNRYGDEITTDDIKDLEENLKFTIADDEITKDWLGTTKETKIRHIWIGKKCVADDGVPYILRMLTLFSENDSPIIHTLELRYAGNTIISRKRVTNFTGLYISMVEKAVSKYAIGIMNRVQFDKYIRGTGAVTFDSKSIKEYLDEYDKIAKLPFTDITKFVKREELKNKLKALKNKHQKKEKQQNKIYSYPTKFHAKFRLSPMAFFDVAQEIIVEFDKDDVVKKIKVE